MTAALEARQWAVGQLMFVLGAIVAVVCTLYVAKQIGLFVGGDTATGRVVAIEDRTENDDDSSSEPSPRFCPVIEFEGPGGSVERFEDGCGKEPELEIGQEVDVLFIPGWDVLRSIYGPGYWGRVGLAGVLALGLTGFLVSLVIARRGSHGR
jgi:hypothetical protein